MANFNIIRDLADTKHISLKEIANKIGISADGLQKIIRNGSTKTATIEEIAKILEVPVGIFFDDYKGVNQTIAHNGSAASIYGNASVGENDKDKEITHLREIVAEKERTIQILMNK